MSNEFEHLEGKDLRAFAEKAGLEVPSRINDDTLKQRIADQLGVVLEAADGTPKAEEKANRPDKIWVKIHASGADKSTVPLFSNGEKAIVKRGEWVHMSFRFYEALRLAVGYSVDPETLELIASPSYPYTAQLEKPSAEFKDMSFS